VWAIESRKDLVTLRSPTPGASFAYRLNDEAERVYEAPFRAESGNEIRARAIRYGYLESDETRTVLP